MDCASLDAGLRLLTRRPGLRLSVNMSARSLADAAWRRVLDRWLADHADAAPRLILEMTEASAMLLPEITVRFMAEMQPKGVAFALDDFGAGAIALTHMKDFLFDLVKVDRRFGRTLDASADDQVVVAALLSIARQFEMFTVVQGIESVAAADAARDLAADCLQGFHVGVPRLSP
ncbi:EAL domain-containing protein [Wenxinia marina]|uniref:EAL domain-containing protein n=1 Tax=Wenxinia marina TaxID=390641 RepID=UPI003F5CD6FB